MSVDGETAPDSLSRLSGFGRPMRRFPRNPERGPLPGILPSSQRDRLTCEPLEPGTLRFVDRALSEQRIPRERATPWDDGKAQDEIGAAILRVVPVKLHTQQPDGHLGGYRWSHDMARYLSSRMPHALYLALVAWYEWWRVPAALAHLAAATDIPPEAVTAVVRWQAGLEPFSRILTRLQRTEGWMHRMHRRIVREVHRPSVMPKPDFVRVRAFLDQYYEPAY